MFLQRRPVKSAPARTGPRDPPILAAVPWVAIAKPLLSGNIWEIAAVDGRCHMAPGTAIETPIMARNMKVGATPKRAWNIADATIHPTNIMPQCFFHASTNTPPTKCTTPDPSCRVENMVAT